MIYLRTFGSWFVRIVSFLITRHEDIFIESKRLDLLFVVIIVFIRRICGSRE
jgi:hypothetical protein